MEIAKNIFHQCFFIPKPSLTEDNLPDQSGRVFIVTGGYTGIGYELTALLYSRNGTIYIAGRNASKASHAIRTLKASHPTSDGRLEFLPLDLSDLASVNAAAAAFKARELRLDVLTNNAGVMSPPVGSEGAQGHELQMVTNTLGPWMFTMALLPLLQKTAAMSPAGAVRVTWSGSLASYAAPRGGVEFDARGEPVAWGIRGKDYAQTKACNVLLAHEFARRFGEGDNGVVSLCWNPGNLKTELQRHQLWWEVLLAWPLLFHQRWGAYTLLFAGWSEEAATEERNGTYVLPWGRFGVPRRDLKDGANGNAVKFWEWCESEAKKYGGV